VVAVTIHDISERAVSFSSSVTLCLYMGDMAFDSTCFLPSSELEDGDEICKEMGVI
jgi:hypothetical protein